MSKKMILISIGLTLIFAVMVSCDLSTMANGLNATQPPNQNAQETLVILAAQQTATHLALADNVSPTSPEVVTATQEEMLATETESLPTLELSETPIPAGTLTVERTATASITASITATVTETTSATATVSPTHGSITPFPTTTFRPTATPIPCNVAAFVADVTIPDGAQFAPGVIFTKTWRLRNAGTCTWTEKYTVVFDNGDQMGGPASIDFSGSVSPGSELEISVKLTAPKTAGKYRGNWRLRDNNGILFGISGGSKPFYVVINVQEASTKYALDMAALYCTAEWSTDTGSLTCPGNAGDKKGYVLHIDNPQLENGSCRVSQILRLSQK